DSTPVEHTALQPISRTSASHVPPRSRRRSACSRSSFAVGARASNPILSRDVRAGGGRCWRRLRPGPASLAEPPVPFTPPTPRTPATTLKLGAHGAAVIALQRALARLGYY